MSFQDSNQGQQPFAPPQQSWGQQSGQQQAPQQGGWGGAQQPPQGGGSGGWGVPPQESQQGYGFGQQSGSGQGFGQPQDYAGQQGYPQQGFPQQGYGPGGQPGYPPQQSDFGTGGYGYPQQPQANSGLATTALWLGILGGWGIINLVISILAINDTGPGKKLGRNKAITGLCLTLAWAVVWAGMFFALSNHAAHVASASAAPQVTISTQATDTSDGGQGAAGSASGSSSDPGCQAAQSAFSTYNQNVTSGGLDAITTLGNALEAAAGQSKTASSQLKAVGQDYLQIANNTTPSNAVSDMVSLEEACGINFDAK